jgi:hypothetical protein
LLNKGAKVTVCIKISLLVVIVLIEITFSLLSSGKAQLECGEYAHTINPAAVLRSHVGGRNAHIIC